MSTVPKLPAGRASCILWDVGQADGMRRDTFLEVMIYGRIQVLGDKFFAATTSTCVGFALGQRLGTGLVDLYSNKGSNVVRQATQLRELVVVL